MCKKALCLALAMTTCDTAYMVHLLHIDTAIYIKIHPIFETFIWAILKKLLSTYHDFWFVFDMLEWWINNIALIKFNSAMLLSGGSLSPEVADRAFPGDISRRQRTVDPQPNCQVPASKNDAPVPEDLTCNCRKKYTKNHKKLYLGLLVR